MCFPEPLRVLTQRVSLSNFSASVAGLSLSGSAEIEQLDGELVFAFSNVTSSFGADFDSLISLTNGQGILVVGDTDVAGSIGVDVAVELDEISLQGNFEVTLKTGTSDVNRTLTLASGQVVQFDLEAGPAFGRLEGQGVSLTALGVTILGDITLEAVDNGADSYFGIQLSNGQLSGFSLFSDSSPLDITNLSLGAVLFQDGIALDAALSLASDLGLLSASADLHLQINTTDRDVAVAGFFDDRTVLAGPEVRVFAYGYALDIGGGSVQLTGDFWYVQALDQPETSLNAANVSAFVGDSTNDVGFRVLNGSGSIVIANGAVDSVTLSASASLVGVPDMTASADLDFSVALEGAVYVTRLTVSNVVLSVADVFSITGGLSVEYSNDRLTIGVANGELFVGTGSLESPTASGFLLSNVSLGIIVFGDGTYAALASGTAAVVGIQDFALSGTLTFRTNATTQAISETIAVAGSDVVLTFTADETSDGTNDFISLEGSNLELVIADTFTVKGAVGFNLLSDGTFETVANITEASMSLGDFKVGLADASMVLLIQSDQTLALDITGSSFILEGADFVGSVVNSVSLQFNNTGTDFSANNRTITIGALSGTLDMQLGTTADPYIKVAVNMTFEISGVGSLSGDFAFERIQDAEGGSVIAISFTNGSINIDNALGTYLTFAEPTAVLLITDAGIVGQVSVSVGFANLPVGSLLSGISFDGDFTLEFNTGTDAFKEDVEVNGITYSFDLPAGAYVGLYGAGLTLSFDGADPASMGVSAIPTISADFFMGAYSNGDVFLSFSNGRIDGFSSSDTSGSISIGDVSGSLNFISEVGVVGALGFSGLGVSALNAEFQVEKVEMFINTTGDTATTLLGGVREVTVPSGFSLFVSDLTIELGPIAITGDFSAQAGDGTVITGSNIEIFDGLRNRSQSCRLADDRWFRCIYPER